MIYHLIIKQINMSFSTVLILMFTIIIIMQWIVIVIDCKTRKEIKEFNKFKNNLLWK